ncbi:hypothetical protein J2Z22_004262 [Paenibacillus forsythiae]|uniref:Transcriptional regulator n=1 Tax=Paenibacillus forsythiae TaxID=365616 RepID=A0ABU3HCX8_9BACL|nr:hypothetical protein [Paenibacillus forsythiae]MDT3428669.1 hypothetical protein [Paenibacillus forsythiae]
MKKPNDLTATAEYREYAITLLKEQAGEAIQLQSLIDANAGKYPNRNIASIRAALWNLHATSEEIVKVGRGKFAYKNGETKLNSETTSSDETVAEQLISSILECYDKHLKRINMTNLTADDFEDLAAVKRAIEELKNSVLKK